MSKAQGSERDPSYFGYYAQFQHQQNMLMDQVRTTAYQTAITASPALFSGKTVMDLGAGSGILSFFSIQANANQVYAVEASGMAKNIQKLAQSRPEYREKVFVVHDKIENSNADRPVQIPPVDTIVSEPIGVLLVHERMLESYLYARDNFLKPGGAMVPSSGTIFLAPFSDAALWTMTMAKVRFWEQPDFHGVDFTPLVPDAARETFAQPVVGCFDSRILMSAAVPHKIDFLSVTESQLRSFSIPVRWASGYTGILHGIAGWFDIELAPGFILSTAPNAERTHWQQVRFLFKDPLAVNAGDVIQGIFHMTVNDNRSYDLSVELHTSVGASRSATWNLHEQTYHYPDPIDISRPEFNAMYLPEKSLE